MAHNKEIPIHVWVDETRPRNQGARLTNWELSHHGINNTVIVDNAGGHLMQKGLVDLVLVGADRVASNGDAANKIGTYLKALAAKEHNIPFYVALPSSTIDWSLNEGLNSIPIENRNAEEVKSYESYINGQKTHLPLMDTKASVSNPSFDVTPAKLISGYITEHGIYKSPLEMK
jgi:methylthioribose-1-phosphate isomerase